MGPPPKLLQAQKGGSGHKNGEGWVGANSSFLSLGAVCDGGQGHPQNGGGRKSRAPLTVFGDVWLLLPPPCPRSRGFPFPWNRVFQETGGPLVPPLPPPGCRPPGMGGDRGSTPKPRRNRRNTPKSEGVPEEMEVLLSVLQDVPLKWGPPYSFFFPLFSKKTGGCTPQAEAPSKSFRVFSFSQRREGLMLLLPAGPSYLCTRTPDPPGFRAVWGFPVFPKRGEGWIQGYNDGGGTT